LLDIVLGIIGMQKDCKEIQPVHSKGDQPWVFFWRNDSKAETPVLWPLDAKSWLLGKDSDAGRDWGQEEKGKRRIGNWKKEVKVLRKKGKKDRIKRGKLMRVKKVTMKWGGGVQKWKREKQENRTKSIEREKFLDAYDIYSIHMYKILALWN